jgi:chromosome segregation ATPase
MLGMGRKKEFSDDKIIETGVSIEKAGEPVSPFAIRNRLGGGSSDRIKNVWQAFDEKRKAESEAEVVMEMIELPSEIQTILEKNLDVSAKMLNRLASESFKVAQSVAEKRVVSTIDEYQAKILSYVEAEKHATQALESCDEKIEELEEKIGALESKNESLLAENAKFSGKIESLIERTSLLEDKEKRFGELQREFGKLEERLKHKR